MSKVALIMAGGTGGHIFPGLAVADELKQRGWQIHWLGTPDRMEADIVPKAGLPIHFIEVKGLRGNGIKGYLLAPFKIIKAVLQARRVIKQIKPRVILGMGGFASGPGGLAAWLKGLPLVLHEQNAVAGMTNNLLSRIAKRVLSGFEQSFAQNGTGKFTVVGNPVRGAFAQLAPTQTHSGPIRLLVVGGSLGAKVLNEQVPNALSRLQSIDVDVYHQCGRGHLDSVTQAYEQLLPQSNTWRVAEFIDDMAESYAWADIIICRAGALTVAEVAAAGRTAIFVPLPHAVDDHQTANARSLTDCGAGYLLPQSALEQGHLVSLLDEVLKSPDTLLTVAEKAKQQAKLDAAQQVANVCEQLAEAA